MTEFFETIMGKRFYEGTMPRIAKSLERIADSLESEKDTILRKTDERLPKYDAPPEITETRSKILKRAVRELIGAGAAESATNLQGLTTMFLEEPMKVTDFNAALKFEKDQTVADFYRLLEEKVGTLKSTSTNSINLKKLNRAIEEVYQEIMYGAKG